MAFWAEFGRHYLQPGDIVLRHGRASCPTALLGSSLISSLCDSPFSHEGLVCFENGHPWVYDMAEEGTRKMPFEVWMLDTVNDTLAIKRLKPAFRDRIPGILGFCETTYQCEVPFDYGMSLDDDRYYCTELVEKAFASVGLPLSEPVPIRCLPGFPKCRWSTILAQLVIDIRLDEPVYSPGNACYGTYSSPLLDLVYQDEVSTKALWNSTPPSCFKR
jgi:hypothetical protein